MHPAAAESRHTSSLNRRRVAGEAMGSLLLLLVLLLGLGGWNYYRNWQLEQAREGPRPYASYATADLEALRGAYTEDLRATEQRLGAAQRQRGRARGDRGSIAGNVDQFSRTTRASTAIRNAAGDLAERQARIEELDRELGYRADLAEGLMLHWKRLTGL